jgi:hypothetical protein
MSQFMRRKTMQISKLGLMALCGAVAVSFAGAAEARTVKHHKRHVIYRHSDATGDVYPVGPRYYGTGLARVVNPTNPVPVNPRNLREPVYVPGNKMTEMRK